MTPPSRVPEPREPYPMPSDRTALLSLVLAVVLAVVIGLGLWLLLADQRPGGDVAPGEGAPSPSPTTMVPS